ncbi:MFS transporter [Luteipulveratus halotolerans]|uniref:MFS transporter n=1 Tax=Luteipulveratus halotolerans TaxID=1631356 RepID=A0A0L6CLV3_9MICO|nr:MFS transporter [Luteipulveratus halotolerans]KNX38498.1 MFS transporter [Luteipulveratus halotolerans]
MALLLDITPLRVNPSYRRLYTGFTLSGIGAQLATVAIGLQVYDITGSTFAVGIVGLCALVPLVAMGLYGGALVDAHDRRKVALIAGLVLWAGSILNTVQAALGNTHVGVLYALVGVYNAGFAVVSPARSAIYPRLLDRALLPAANALSVAAMNIAMTVGPLMAGVLVDWGGYVLAYGIDALLFTFAIWGLLRLEPIPPEIDPTANSGVPQRRPGLSSVLDGLRFLGTRPNVRMTFLADFCAMILAQPRALFPAVAALSFGGGAKTVGILSAAVAVGAIISMAVSGPLGHVRRQGLAVVVSVALWGVSIVGFGLAVAGAGGVLTSDQALWLGAVALACAGACDSVSAVFRTTILQSATPDHLRGRLQGVFVVVVAGGPRLGDLLAGSGATLWNEATAAVVGGILCVIAVLLLASWQRGFLRYDAQHPTP